MEKVVVYAPGALVGHSLRECCGCRCHRSRFGVMHMFPCCQAVPGFAGFPELDDHGTPTAKLPPCPHCREDELGVLNRNEVRCHRCGWRLVRLDEIGVTT